MKEQLIYLCVSTSDKTIAAGKTIAGYNWGSYSGWVTFKSPTSKNTKVKYDAKKKNVVGAVTGWGSGGVTRYGTAIPAKATRAITIAGVTQNVSCNVRYRMRGYTIYDRPSSLKKDKKMWKKAYTYYQYQLQYQDAPYYSTVYTTYASGFEYVHFAPKYYDTGTKKENSVSGCLMHPQKFTVNMSDIRRNLESNTNNSDGRDNAGTFVLSNVRNNVFTIEMEWEGVSESDGQSILHVLTPHGAKKYIICQFINPITGTYETKTFYPSERKSEKYSNGVFKSISCTLTEV